MSVKSKVSVIVPAYNAATYLPESIDSVLAQTYQDFEIILVDDGSTDQINCVVEKYRSQLRYMRQENKGPSAARNTGIRMALGEYLVFLDADDLIFTKKLALQAAFLDEHPDISIVYSDGYCIKEDENGNEVRESFASLGYIIKSLAEPEDSLKVLLIQNGFPLHAAMVRKRAIDKVDGFDESLRALEDWDLWVRLAHEHRFAYLDAIVAKYRIVEGSVSHQYVQKNIALRQIKRKIETSEIFASLPSITRADFYFHWGVQELDFGEADLAISKFRAAIALHPTHLLSRIALFLTSILGHKAVIFYHLKRRVFGVRGSQRYDIVAHVV